jgi:hypothetical protein
MPAPIILYIYLEFGYTMQSSTWIYNAPVICFFKNPEGWYLLAALTNPTVVP